MRIILLFVFVILISFGNAFAGEDTYTDTCNAKLAVAESACTSDLYFANFSKCMLDAKTIWNICKIDKVQHSESNKNKQPLDTRG